jgi:hypothetical protein
MGKYRYFPNIEKMSIKISIPEIRAYVAGIVIFDSQEI